MCAFLEALTLPSHLVDYRQLRGSAAGARRHVATEFGGCEGWALHTNCCSAVKQARGSGHAPRAGLKPQGLSDTTQGAGKRPRTVFDLRGDWQSLWGPLVGHVFPGKQAPSPSHQAMHSTRPTSLPLCSGLQGLLYLVAN